LTISKKIASFGNIQSSLMFLVRSSYKTADTHAKKYEEYNPGDYSQINTDLSNQEFQKKYKEYISSVRNFSTTQDNIRHEAKIFYDLGLIAYETGQMNATEYFLKYAIFLDPFFSYYHVELANYYFIQGNVKRTEEILEMCNRFGVTSENCNIYKNNNFLKNYPEKVGFSKNNLELFIK
jgi:hypothetical protein